MKMNACRECIVYKVHHNQAAASECQNCGKKTLIWKQHGFGTFFLECSSCGSLTAVDLNTPCELDPLFREKTKIMVEPHSKEFDKCIIHDLSKRFCVNSLQMRDMLMKGFAFESEIIKVNDYASLFEHCGLSYRIIESEDPRSKYLFYKQCNYPYSAMRNY